MTTAANTYPKTLVVIRDCHAKHNLVVTAHTADDEQLYRKMASRKQWKVAVRKPKTPKAPTCDMHGQWIPDNEHQPVCDLHRAFSLTLTPIARKGGAK